MIELSLVSNPPMFLFYKKLSKLVLPNLIGSPLLKVYSQMIFGLLFLIIAPHVLAVKKRESTDRARLLHRMQDVCSMPF